MAVTGSSGWTPCAVLVRRSARVAALPRRMLRWRSVVGTGGLGLGVGSVPPIGAGASAVVQVGRLLRDNAGAGSEALLSVYDKLVAGLERAFGEDGVGAKSEIDVYGNGVDVELGCVRVLAAAG